VTLLLLSVPSTANAIGYRHLGLEPVIPRSNPSCGQPSLPGLPAPTCASSRPDEGRSRHRPTAHQWAMCVGTTPWSALRIQHMDALRSGACRPLRCNYQQDAGSCPRCYEGNLNWGRWIPMPVTLSTRSVRGNAPRGRAISQN